MSQAACKPATQSQPDFGYTGRLALILWPAWPRQLAPKGLYRPYNRLQRILHNPAPRAALSSSLYNVRCRFTAFDATSFHSNLNFMGLFRSNFMLSRPKTAMTLVT
jgi:hypothetical protein